MSTRVLIADDHKIFREGLRALLEKQRGIEVVAEAKDGLEAVRFAQKLIPDVVIMDVAMPEKNGIEATRETLEVLPRTKVIALSMHSDRRFVLQMLKAGAVGYLLKDSAFEELAAAIQAVSSGQTYLSPKITDVVIKEYLHSQARSEVSVFTILTHREREVLQLLAEGKSTKEIAATLHVSVKTIETHRQQVMDKLDIHSVAELTKYAIREGLTTLEP
jgi:two-component system, NarL family, response regulator NreC